MKNYRLTSLMHWKGVITDKILELDGYKRSLAEKMEAYEDKSSEARNALEDISMCIDELVRDIRNGMAGGRQDHRGVGEDQNICIQAVVR